VNDKPGIHEHVAVETIQSRLAEQRALAQLVREQMKDDRKQLEMIAESWSKKNKEKP
jgi:hypothetical protein